MLIFGIYLKLCFIHIVNHIPIIAFLIYFLPYSFQ
jgi:hypothetical protein